jgi:hypothetical protein
MFHSRRIDDDDDDDNNNNNLDRKILINKE